MLGYLGERRMGQSAEVPGRFTETSAACGESGGASAESTAAHDGRRAVDAWKDSERAVTGSGVPGDGGVGEREGVLRFCGVEPPTRG
jgi:hypothetical protein